MSWPVHEQLTTPVRISVCEKLDWMAHKKRVCSKHHRDPDRHIFLMKILLDEARRLHGRYNACLQHIASSLSDKPLGCIVCRHVF